MRKFKIVVALLFVILAGAAGAYIAFTDKDTTFDPLSFFMEVSGPSDSDAVKAGKQLLNAAEKGLPGTALQATTDLNKGLVKCQEESSSPDAEEKCLDLLGSMSERLGIALGVRSEKLLGKDKFREKFLPQISPTTQLSAAPSVMQNSDNVPVRHISPEAFAELEREITAGGGTIVAQPNMVEEIRPDVTQPLKPLEPMVVTSPLAEAPKAAKVSNEFISPTCSVTQTGSKLIKLRKDLEKLEKAGKLTATQRCQLGSIRQGWRERKTLMAKK